MDSPGCFDSHQRPRCTRWRYTHGLCLLRRHGYANARQTSTMISIILANPCGDCETMQASYAYIMPHTAERTQSIAGSGPIDVERSFRCTTSARMFGSSLNLWRTTFITAHQSQPAVQLHSDVSTPTSPWSPSFLGWDHQFSGPHDGCGKCGFHVIHTAVSRRVFPEVPSNRCGRLLWKLGVSHQSATIYWWFSWGPQPAGSGKMAEELDGADTML